MSTDTLFENSEQQASEATPEKQEQAATPKTDSAEPSQPQTSTFDQLLGSITAEDGRQKYSSVEDALKSLGHAQEHIRTLEKENREYKEQMSKLDEMNERLSKYEELLARGASSQDNRSDNSGQGLDEATVAQLVQQQLTQAQQQQLAQKNGMQVVEKLTEQFGSREAAAKAFSEKAAELDVDEGFLTDLAKRSPKAVLSYFGTKSSSTPAKTQGNVNTASFQSETPAAKNHKLYGNTGDLVANWRASADNVKSKRGLE